MFQKKKNRSLFFFIIIIFSSSISGLKGLSFSPSLILQSTVTQALDYIQKIHTDQGGANLWGALSWVYRQPNHRSCPRQLFIIMDGTCSNVGHVLELVRRNACNVR